MSDNQDNLIAALADVLQQHEPQANLQNNVDAVAALMKCAAAIATGAVDKGWIPDNMTAELYAQRAIVRAFKTVRGED
jgi:hypothetical protein